MNRSLRRYATAVLAACALAAAPLAFALAGGADDRSVAEAVLQDLDRDEAHKAVVGPTAQKARDALERGRRMRAAGDEAHAKIADGVAREWAEMARDLAKAADLEAAAAQARRDAIDAGALLDRERALLEEGIARTGRLRAQLESAEREAKDTNRTATGITDGGAPPKKPKRAGDGGAR
jgi:hypothetical protein